jgi:hypothetical protein
MKYLKNAACIIVIVLLFWSIKHTIDNYREQKEGLEQDERDWELSLKRIKMTYDDRAEKIRGGY